MTGIRPSVQQTWDQTVLWLDHLYGDSTNPGDVTESAAAESVLEDEQVLAARAALAAAGLDADVVDEVGGAAHVLMCS